MRWRGDRLGILEVSGAAPRLAIAGTLDLWLLGSGQTELSHTIVSALAVRHASGLFASPLLRGLPLPRLVDPMHGLWCCGRNEDGALAHWTHTMFTFSCWAGTKAA